jgi:hypothetical protein
MIPTRRIFEICIFIAVMIIAAMAFHAWLASHDDQLRLQATLATQKQQLDAANDRERDRAATLNQTLADIEKLKRETQTPQQILRDLPQYLKLPQPITLDSPANVNQADEQRHKQNGEGTGAASNAGGAERSASSGAVAPELNPSRSVLGGVREALQRKPKGNSTAVTDATRPAEANRSASASSAAIQTAPTSSTKSGAEAASAALKSSSGSATSRILGAIRKKLRKGTTRQGASGGNLPDPENQRASASPSPSQSALTPPSTPNAIQTSATASATSAGTRSDVVPDAAGRSASALPNSIQREIPPTATSTAIQAVQSFPPTSAATTATEARRSAADKSASAASGNVPADANTSAISTFPPTSAATSATEARLSAADKSASAASGNVPAGANASAISTPAQATRSSSTAPPSSAEIPAADLKPLYDYVQDCRACQARLIAATQNRADDAAKLQALTRERDAAITTAKGGTFWRRLRRNAEWFVIGAATAAAVVAAHGLDHHR